MRPQSDRAHRPGMLAALLLALAAILALPASPDTAEPSVASGSEFVASWIAALAASGEALEIEIVDDLEITAKADGLTIRASGREAYARYLAAPATRDEQIALLVRMVREALATAGAAPDAARIVPVIKPADWLEKYRLDCPYYPLPGDLIAVLAEDRPDEVRYLRTDDLNQLGRPIPELFAAAIANLRRVAPVEEHDLGNLVMLSSGGNYEAGLMLDAELIASFQPRFAGEIVFAVPAGDVFVLTGRDDRQGLGGIVRAICLPGDSEASLSTKLFAVRDGALEVAGEVDCGGELPVLTLD